MGMEEQLMLIFSKRLDKLRILKKTLGYSF